MTEQKVKDYVKLLTPELQEIYKSAKILEKTIRDTLSEDFQVAASITSVFEQRASAYFNGS